MEGGDLERSQKAKQLSAIGLRMQKFRSGRLPKSASTSIFFLPEATVSSFPFLPRLTKLKPSHKQLAIS